MKSENRGISNPSALVIIVHLSTLVSCRINWWTHEIKLWLAPEMLQEKNMHWMKHPNPHWSIPHHPKIRSFCFSLASSAAQDPTSQHSQPGTAPTAAPGNPCVPCPNPSGALLPALGTPQAGWCHDHMLLAPLRKNRLKPDPHCACKHNSNSMGLFTQVLAHLQVQHFAKSQLTVHKDLNVTNQPMIYGLRAGHGFVSMHCKQWQAQCWHTNMFK